MSDTNIRTLRGRAPGNIYGVTPDDELLRQLDALGARPPMRAPMARQAMPPRLTPPAQQVAQGPLRFNVEPQESVGGGMMGLTPEEIQEIAMRHQSSGSAQREMVNPGSVRPFQDIARFGDVQEMFTEKGDAMQRQAQLRAQQQAPAAPAYTPDDFIEYSQYPGGVSMSAEYSPGAFVQAEGLARRANRRNFLDNLAGREEDRLLAEMQQQGQMNQDTIAVAKTTQAQNSKIAERAALVDLLGDYATKTPEQMQRTLGVIQAMGLQVDPKVAEMLSMPAEAAEGGGGLLEEIGGLLGLTATAGTASAGARKYVYSQAYKQAIAKGYAADVAKTLAEGAVNNAGRRLAGNPGMGMLGKVGRAGQVSRWGAALKAAKAAGLRGTLRAGAKRFWPLLIAEGAYHAGDWLFPEGLFPPGAAPPPRQNVEE